MSEARTDIRSSLRLEIDFSSVTVICPILPSTAPSASPVFARKVSRASLRSSFLTASAAGILTSYLSSRSYISFTCMRALLHLAWTRRARLLRLSQ